MYTYLYKNLVFVTKLLLLLVLLRITKSFIVVAKYIED